MASSGNSVFYVFVIRGQGLCPQAKAIHFQHRQEPAKDSGILENGGAIGSPSGVFYVQFVYDRSDGMGKLVAFSVEPACQPEDIGKGPT